MFVKCPYCGYEDDICHFPDIFVGEKTKALKEQENLLVEIQEAGYNVVTCASCDSVFIYRTKGE